jgi:hypothetical protein
VRIDDLATRIDRFSAYIDAHFDELEPDQIKALMALHGSSPAASAGSGGTSAS